MDNHRNHLMSDAYASMYLNEEQIDEVAPAVAALAKSAGKAALTSAASTAGSNIANKMTKPKNEEVEEDSYTAAYMEAYKKLPAAKMQDKAAMKPDTAKGESQARKMDTVRKATKAFPDVVKGAVKGQQLDNNKKGLEKKFAGPSADKGAKNKAYKLENQRRQDLNKRYGPKSEEAEAVLAFLIDGGFALSEDSAFSILNHMSDEWFESIVEETLNEG